MKRKLRGLMAVILIFFVFSPFGLNAVAFAANDSIKVSMQVGVPQAYKLGYSVPLYFQIDNADKNINGELQVEVPNVNDSKIVYAVKLNLPADSDKKLTVNIPFGHYISDLRVNIVEDKSTIYTQNFSINVGSLQGTEAGRAKMDLASFYGIDGGLRTIPELPMPKTGTLLVLFILYILTAAPISYIILKRLDKREWMWLTVPLVSLAFSLAVYISGYGTRITEPIVNILSILHIDEGGRMTKETFAGIFTPTKRTLKVEGPKNTTISPLISFQESYRSSQLSKEANKITAKVMLEPQNTIEFYGSEGWSMKEILLEGGIGRQGKIESSLEYRGSDILGSIKNTTGLDLEDCFIISSYRYISVGTLKNGESKEINGMSQGYFASWQNLVNALYDPLYQGRAGAKDYTTEELQKLREVNQKRHILEYYLRMAMDTGGTKIIAWSRTPVVGDIKVNDKSPRRFEKSMIIAPLDIRFKAEGVIELPYGFIAPEIMPTTGQIESADAAGVVRGDGSFEAHFRVNPEIKVQEVKLRYPIADENVREYIWNVQTQEWEQGSGRDRQIDALDIAKYIDGENTIRLRFEIRGTQVKLPEMALKGSVK